VFLSFIFTLYWIPGQARNDENRDTVMLDLIQHPASRIFKNADRLPKALENYINHCENKKLLKRYIILQL
jgi:hypothetical protein